MLANGHPEMVFWEQECCWDCAPSERGGCWPSRLESRISPFLRAAAGSTELLILSLDGRCRVGPSQNLGTWGPNIERRGHLPAPVGAQNADSRVSSRSSLSRRVGRAMLVVGSLKAGAVELGVTIILRVELLMGYFLCAGSRWNRI